MHKTLRNETCPKCRGRHVTHPKNYGKPQTDRRWCLDCGHLWTPGVKPQAALLDEVRARLTAYWDRHDSRALPAEVEYIATVFGISDGAARRLIAESRAGA